MIGFSTLGLYLTNDNLEFYIDTGIIFMNEEFSKTNFRENNQLKTI